MYKLANILPAKIQGFLDSVLALLSPETEFRGSATLRVMRQGYKIQYKFYMSFPLRKQYWSSELSHKESNLS